MDISSRKIQASMIDYPQPDLPEDIWATDRAGQKHLRPEVKNLLDQMAGEIMVTNFKNPRDYYEGILIGSSIASQFYTPSTDIDVKIIMDFPRFKQNNPEYAHMDDNELIKALIEVARVYKNKVEYNGHPIEFFFLPMSIINTKDFLAHFDSLYNVTLRTWMITPKRVDIKEYDRDKVVREGEEQAIEWAEKWDLDIGSIKRKLADFVQVVEYLASLPEDESERLKEKVSALANEITREIEEISDDREEVKEERREAYEKYADNIEDYYGYINALPDVIQMKMLTHWGYMRIIKELDGLGEEISARGI